MPLMPRAVIAANHFDARPPVQKIVRFVGSFCSRHWSPPSGFLHWRTAQGLP